MNVFFATRPTVGNYQLNPLSAGRLAILQERGNPLALEDLDNAASTVSPTQAEVWTLGEVLFVCIATGAELAQWSLDSAEDWRARVRGFVIDLEADVLLAFSERLKLEIQAITESQVVAIEAPGKRRGRPRK